MGATDHFDEPRAPPGLAPEDGYIPPEDPESNDLPIPTERQPWWVVFLPSLAFAGVQLSWGVQIGHTSAHLRHMGLADKFVGLAWLAGPVSGIVVQPLVGVWSDRCRSPLGRRRPFMIAGAVLVALSLVLFAFSGNIAALLGDPIPATGGGSKTGLGIALAAFWVLDFNINVLQSPTRALLADVVHPSQLATGNACFAVANGLGKTSAYVLGSVFKDVRRVNSVAAGLMLVLSFLPAIFVRGDKPAPPPIRVNGEQPLGPCGTFAKTMRDVGAAMRVMPKGIRQVFIVQSFSYLAFMLVFIYVSIYFGQLNGGDPTAAKNTARHKLFEDGVQLANRALLAMSIVSMVVAPLVPKAARLLGTRPLWGGSLFIMGVALICTIATSSKVVAILITVSVGLPLSNAMTIPWAITALTLEGELTAARGLYFSVFNLSQAVPGLFSSFLGSLVVFLSKGNLAWPLVIAGIAAVLGALSTWWVDIPKELDVIKKIESMPEEISSPVGLPTAGEGPPLRERR